MIDAQKSFRPTHHIICGDSRKMHLLEDSSIHLVVTSPPYWQLKDYGIKAQIGYHDSYEDYINNLNLVWQECHRVLHPGCRLCINVGDQYARAAYYGRYKVIPIRTEIIKFCEACGFDYMGAVIWQKSGTMNPSGGGSVMGSFPYPRNGILKLDYEFILIFKKQGKMPVPSLEYKKESALSTEDWNRYFSGHWNFPGVRQDKHLAMFPAELPKRLIRMFSFVGDTVLDPFAGSGTTNLVADSLRRTSVGYEIHPKFIQLIREKLEPTLLDAYPDKYKFSEDNTEGDMKHLFQDLPYLFQDPHRLERLTNPPQHSFGSKISGHQEDNQEFFLVKEIMSPILIRLHNGAIVRLIGIAPKEVKNHSAIQFLMEKTVGQKVFLKYDVQRHDEHKHLLGYLFLKNKTFINAKLIRQGLANVDTHMNFKYKDKFLNLQNGA